MTNDSGSYRLLTRSDFDGLVCAMLLKELGILAEIKFVHPKDVQDGKVEVTSRDILTNLPYVPGCHRSFDHHKSEESRTANVTDEHHVLDANADSAARVVYNYYGGAERFKSVGKEILDAVDKADAAKFTKEEVLHPTGWVLLSFIMDPRTGLGRFRDFRVSNYQLMMDLVDRGMDHSIEQILELPDVKERAELYHAHHEKSQEQLRRCSKVYGNLVVLDLRNEETIHATNRFMIYALYPDCNISIHEMWGLKKQNTVFAIGKSIFNRTSKTDVGELALRYGGGGHANAGTCQVANEDADRVLKELIATINADG